MAGERLMDRRVFVDGIRTELDIARSILPRDLEKPIFVNHRLVPNASVPAWKFLVNLPHIDERILGRILDSDSRWIFQGDTSIDPFDPLIPIGTLNKKIKAGVSPFYALNDASLAESQETGVNSHDIRHAERVTKGTVDLLIAGKYSLEEQKRGVMAGWGHDLGNFLSREAHTLMGPEIFRRVFPNVTKDGDQWRKLQREMGFHDTTLMQPFIDALGDIPPEEVITHMREVIGPVGLALMLADKAHIGPDRLSYKANTPDLINKDLHKIINLLVQTTSLRVSNSGKSLIWGLQFDTHVPPEDAEKFPDLVEASNIRGGKLRVVSGITTDKNSGQKLSLNTIDEMFTRIYPNRYELITLAAFALFPDVKTVRIEMYDEPKGSTVPHTKIDHTYYRESVNKLFVRSNRYAA